MTKDTKESEKLAENEYKPDKKNKSDTDKDIESVHEQINDSFNQGTIEDKKKEKNKEN